MAPHCLGLGIQCTSKRARLETSPVSFLISWCLKLQPAVLKLPALQTPWMSGLILISMPWLRLPTLLNILLLEPSLLFPGPGWWRRLLPWTRGYFSRSSRVYRIVVLTVTVPANSRYTTVISRFSLVNSVFGSCFSWEKPSRRTQTTQAAGSRDPAQPLSGYSAAS